MVSKNQLPASAPHPTVPGTMPFMWQNCKYSPNLKDATLVNTSFAWNIDNFQISSDKDTADLLFYQEKIAEHVKKGQPMRRSPIVDEIVIAPYEGDYYRGRVVQVTEEKCHVVFVDFGDDLTLNHQELYAINPQLFKAPLYSARIRLYDVEEKVKLGKKLEDVIKTSLKLQMVDEIVMSEKDLFQVVLWVSEGESLNELVDETLTEIALDEMILALKQRKQKRANSSNMGNAFYITYPARMFGIFAIFCFGLIFGGGSPYVILPALIILILFGVGVAFHEDWRKSGPEFYNADFDPCLGSLFNRAATSHLRSSASGPEQADLVEVKVDNEKDADAESEIEDRPKCMYPNLPKFHTV